MAIHLSILAVRTPWTVWKGKKTWHQKMSPPQVRKYPMCYWDEKLRKHLRLSGHEFEWTPGVGDGQGLECCDSDTIEWLNWTELTWAAHLSVSYLFAFSYCSWGSQGKNTEVVCPSLLQWTTFCQNSPPWPVHLGWPYRAWLIVSLS